MKIKSFILAVILSGVSIITFAQKEISTAKINYEEYRDLKGTAGVEKLSALTIKNAKQAVDKGILNPKLQSDPTLWAYRAMIYADYALLDTVESSAAPLIAEAISSMNKASELDKTGANKIHIESTKALLVKKYLDQGVKHYSAKAFPKAYNQFKQGLEYSPKDSVLTLYSALVALYDKDYKNAIEHYKTAIANKQVNADVYNNLTELLIVEKDTVSAIKYASEGASLFKDANLATREIEYSLMMGKTKEIIDKITEQIKNEPNNKLFPYYLGIAYNESGDLEKAEEAYRAAIALDATFPEPTINLASLLLNKGILLYNAANKLPQNQQAAYAEGMKKASAQFEVAYPYLLKATELNPKSRSALMNLRTYYNIKRDAVKSAEITKLLEDLPAN